MNLASVIACGISPAQARRFAPPLSVYCPRFDITAPARLAAFIAQCNYESGGFANLEESLYYRTAADLRRVFGTTRFKTIEAAEPYVRRPKPLANYVYANRLGNGDEASGDGWRFRGRGAIQLTGRSNYLAMGRVAHRDWVSHPEDLLSPAGAVLSACSYWQANDCNTLADARDIDGLTRQINGRAMLGAAKRRALFDQAYEVLMRPPLPE